MLNIFKKVSHKRLPKYRDSSVSSLEPSTYLWSPVPHLLTTNDPPSEEERELIIRSIQEMETKLCQNQVEGDLIVKESVAFIQRLRAILSPIRRVPSEILQEIIIFAAVGKPMEKFKEFRWQISYVSRAWRNAALSLSVLWAELPVLRPPLKNPSFKKIQHQAACIAEILRRSGNIPLTVFIEEERKWGIVDYPALNLVMEHCERWKTLSLSFPLAMMNALRPIAGRLPLLETLYLHMPVGMGDIDHSPPNLFAVAPLLRRVHVVGAVPPSLEMPPASQFVHYKHLYISQMRLSQVVNYSCLETLMISQTRIPIFFPPATFQQLKKLEFITTIPAQGNDALRCFNALKLPSLEDLTVVFPFSSPSILPSLISMLSNTGISRKVHTLRLNPGSMLPGELTTLLKLTPALTALDITVPPHTDIENLASERPNGQSYITPDLKICKFVFDSLVETFLDPKTRAALHVLAQERCEAQHESLKLSVYSMSSEVHNVTWSYFKQLQLEGWEPANVAKRLCVLHQTLRAKLAAIRKQDNNKQKQSLMPIFENIENVQISAPEDIYSSGILIPLQELLQCEGITNSIPGFRQRVQSLVTEWDYLVRHHIPKIHWCCAGSHSVVYVSDHDALRTSENVLDIVHGLNHEIPSDEARWTFHLGIYGITLHWPRKERIFEMSSS